jgi:RND family efflux transporter, MFP subunit
MTRRRIASFILLSFPLLLLACKESNQAPKSEYKQEQKTFKVSSTEVQSFIETTGSVQPDIEGTSKISAHLPGLVSKIYVKVGDHVKKGDLLVAVTSPDITDIYSSYLSTQTQLKQAERIYNLNKELFEVGAVTKNDLLTSESNLKQSKAMSDGLRTKLTIYGWPSDENLISQSLNRLDTILIKASLDGTVTDISAHLGDRVDTSTVLMTLADPQKSVIVANIYDTDIQKIKKGNKVQFLVDAFPDVTLKGIVSYVGDMSDPETKTTKAYIRILDRKDLFKSNMFLRLKIEDEKKILAVIPQSAMVFMHGKFYAYCSNGSPKKYDLKEIKPIHEVSGKLMAVEGIKVGEEVVYSAIEMEKP